MFRILDTQGQMPAGGGRVRRRGRLEAVRPEPQPMEAFSYFRAGSVRTLELRQFRFKRTFYKNNAHETCCDVWSLPNIFFTLNLGIGPGAQLFAGSIRKK